MHTLELGNSVPAFLTKLWKLVEDSKCDSLISWSASGTSFIIRDQARFAKELLPLYFKHNNMASFIRQLNMYGFRKMSSIEQGGLRLDHDEMEFYHHYFCKGQEVLLDYIKRKVPSGRTGDEARLKPELLKEVMADVKVVRGKQENMDTLLNRMKQENESLWREVTILRQKHQKQQHMVEKLIQFIVTLVQPNRNLGVKRKLPLMIHDGPSDEKRPHLSRQFSRERRTDLDFTLSSPSQLDSSGKIGPVIHDVTDAGDINDCLLGSKAIQQSSLSSDSIISPEISFIRNKETLSSSPHYLSSTLINSENVLEPLCILDTLESDMTSLSPDADLLHDTEIGSLTEVSGSNTTIPNLPLSPLSETSGLLNTSTSTVPLKVTSSDEPSVILNKQVDNSAKVFDSKDEKDDSSLSSDMQVAISDPGNSFSTSLLRGSYSDYLDNVETELEWLQDQLSGGFNIDPATWLGIFGTDDSLFCNNILFDNGTENTGAGNEITGNELIQYTRTVQSDCKSEENSLDTDSATKTNILSPATSPKSSRPSKSAVSSTDNPSTSDMFSSHKTLPNKDSSTLFDVSQSSKKKKCRLYQGKKSIPKT